MQGPPPGELEGAEMGQQQPMTRQVRHPEVALSTPRTRGLRTLPDFQVHQTQPQKKGGVFGFFGGKKRQQDQQGDLNQVWSLHTLVLK